MELIRNVEVEYQGNTTSRSYILVITGILQIWHKVTTELTKTTQKEIRLRTAALETILIQAFEETLIFEQTEITVMLTMIQPLLGTVMTLVV